mmetsp:Transcript_4312/g.11641  ORF Transcript_4312/g.11641 Transcript_4312/m.11641 type:complete len:409 (+) Transcript_4312:73-1299(+)
MSPRELHPPPSFGVLGNFLTEEGLRQLTKFKYTAGSYTTLDLFLNHWWLFVAKFVPKWVSPNAITLSGLVGVLLAVLLTALVRQGEPETYINGHAVHFFAAAMVFAYQTLDAVDGKHARNTGQSTPLGAVFDHGCDALVMSFNAMLVEMQTSDPAADAQDLSPVVGSLGALMPMLSFFAGQWEHYHTGVIEAGGVTEAQYSCITLAVMSAVGGSSLFQTKLLAWVPFSAATLPPTVSSFAADTTLKRFLSYGVVSFAVLVLSGCALRTVRGRTASMAHVVGSFIPGAVHIGFCFLVCSASLYRKHRLICLTAALLGFADVNIRMVLAGVCHFRFPVLHLTLVPFSLVSMLLVYSSLTEEVQLIMVCAVIVWQIVSILWLATDSISRTCAHLGIPFLAPCSPPDTKKAS